MAERSSTVVGEPFGGYGERVHRGYDEGRARSSAELDAWMSVLAAYAPARRPLSVADLGCGTGHFAAPLAERFGGVVYAIEPSASLRQAAVRLHPHPRVVYVGGRAEAIPLATGSCDVVVMFLSLHHVANRLAAAHEIARVLRADGRVFINTGFSGELLDQAWYRFFPRARDIEDGMFPTRHETLATFARAGLTMTDLTIVRRPGVTLANLYQQLQKRAVSTFAFLTEDEVAAGFAAMRAAVDSEAEPVPLAQEGMLLILAPVPGQSGPGPA